MVCQYKQYRAVLTITSDGMSENKYVKVTTLSGGSR